MDLKLGGLGTGNGSSSNKVDVIHPKGVDSELGTYISEERVCLDLIWSKETPFPLPVIVYFHSDSLMSSDSKKGLPICGYLAKRGYMVLNANLKPMSNNLSIEDELNDIISIFGWISENSEKYNLDPGSIYVTGSMYGGLPAIWSTVLFSTSRIRDYFDVPELGIRICGVGLFTGFSDPFSVMNKLLKPLPKAFRKIGDDNPGLASCLCVWDNHDLRTMPPVFQASSPEGVTYPESVRLDNLMEVNGVPHELLLFPKGEKSFGIFLERSPDSVYSTRAISKMLNLFQAYQ